MKIRCLNALLFTLLLTSAGCQKKDSSGNPCDGLMNESPPTNIMIKFVEKGTDQNLILTKNIQPGDVSVVDNTTGKPVLNWRIQKNDSSGSPLNGVVQFSIFPGSPGQHAYRIEVNKIGTATMAYTVTKTATGNVCKPEAYPVSEIKITDRAFTQLTYDGKSYPNILVLEL